MVAICEAALVSTMGIAIKGTNCAFACLCVRNFLEPQSLALVFDTMPHNIKTRHAASRAVNVVCRTIL